MIIPITHLYSENKLDFEKPDNTIHSSTTSLIKLLRYQTFATLRTTFPTILKSAHCYGSPQIFDLVNVGICTQKCKLMIYPCIA